MSRVVPIRRGGGFGDANSDALQWIYDAGWTAVRAAQARQAFFGDPATAQWSELANLINIIAAVDSGRFTVAQAAPEIQQRTASINAYLSAAGASPLPPIDAQDPGPPQPAGDVDTVDMSPTTTTQPVVPITPVSLPVDLDPNQGTVAVITPSGEVVVGSGQQNADGTVTVTTATGATVTGAPVAVADSGGGVLSGIEDTIAGYLGGFADQFGVSVQTLEIIIVAGVLGGLYLMSGSKKRR